MGLKLTSFDDAILNTTKGRTNKYGDDVKNNILYSPWPKNFAPTMDDFYTDFIEPRLPDPAVVLQWHEVIKDYASRKGRIYPVRDGNQKTKLRRGWLVSVNSDFSYMFTDNDLAVYIYKMALDGFCPTKDEFFEYMTEFKDPSNIGWLEEKRKKTGVTVKNAIDANELKPRKFLSMPARFNQAGGPGIDKTEPEKNAYINMPPAPACCLGQYNYKHSHIIDVAKKEYIIPGAAPIKWENIKANLIGKNTDYQWSDTISNYVWERTLSTAQEKELDNVLRAHLFRFLDPLNHFLAPMLQQNKFTREDGSPATDIAEYENLQKYLIQQKNAIFHTDFKSFITATCPPSELVAMSWKSNGAEAINICYHEKTFSVSAYGNMRSKKTKKAASGATPKKAASKTSSPKSSAAALHALAKKYSYDQKLEVAAHYLRSKDGLEAVEKIKLKLTNGKGWHASAILNELGIATNGSLKNLLNTSSIDNEIAKAADPVFKATLEEIKNRGL